MRTEGCREWRTSLGAYALGHLERDESVALEAHIEGCAACRAELESLGSVARLLPLADPARIETPPVVPTGLLERITGEIGTERWRARRKRLQLRISLGGLAAAAAVAAALALFALPGGTSRSPEQTVAFHDLPAGMRISAHLQPTAFGTQIQMYVDGVRSGTLCRVFLEGPAGTRLSAGSFRYRWGSDSRAELSAGLDLSRTEAVGVKVGDRLFIAPVARS